MVTEMITSKHLMSEETVKCFLDQKCLKCNKNLLDLKVEAVKAFFENLDMIEEFEFVGYCSFCNTFYDAQGGD